MSLHNTDAIKIRIEAARDAASRSRFALLATTVAALSFLIAEFNAYLSWNRGFPLAPDTELVGEASPTGLVQRRLLSDWVDSTSMNVNLLGIHASASDATILGGAALFFLTLWFYYSVRRENRVVGALLRETQDADVSLMDLAFSGVVSYMVFTAINPRKKPTSTLADRPFGQASDPPLGPQKFRGVQLLLWLAPFAILLSMTLDILSIVYLEAPFRREHRIAWPAGTALAKFIAFNLVGGAGLIATVVNLWRVSGLDAATGAVLREYKEVFKIKRDALRMLQAGHAKGFNVPPYEGGVRVEVRIEADRVHMQFEFSDADLYADVEHALRRNEIPYRGQLTAAGDHRVVVARSDEIGEIDPRTAHAVREHYRLKRVMWSLRGHRARTASPGAPGSAMVEPVH